MFAKKITEKMNIINDRRYLEQSIEAGIGRAMREAQELAFVVLHFANLAELNLSIELLNDCIIPTISQNHRLEVIARLDDSNFGLFFSASNEVEAYRYASQINQLLQEDIILKTLPVPLKVKFGISSYPQLAKDANALLSQASMALQNGRKSDKHNQAVIRIWKAAPRADLNQLNNIDDMEVCRAILQGYQYFSIPRTAYRWLDNKIIPIHFAESNFCVPIKRQKDVLTVAMPNPANGGLVSQLAEMTGYAIVPVVSTRTEIERALQYLSRLIPD